MGLWRNLSHGGATRVLLVLLMPVLVLLVLLSEALTACGLKASVSRVRKGKGFFLVILPSQGYAPSTPEPMQMQWR